MASLQIFPMIIWYGHYVEERCSGIFEGFSANSSWKVPDPCAWSFFTMDFACAKSEDPRMSVSIVSIKIFPLALYPSIQVDGDFSSIRESEKREGEELCGENIFMAISINKICSRCFSLKEINYRRSSFLLNNRLSLLLFFTLSWLNYRSCLKSHGLKEKNFKDTDLQNSLDETTSNITTSVSNTGIINYPWHEKIARFYLSKFCLSKFLKFFSLERVCHDASDDRIAWKYYIRYRESKGDAEAKAKTDGEDEKRWRENERKRVEW